MDPSACEYGAGLEATAVAVAVDVGAAGTGEEPDVA